ncbi:MAG TPA: hypothetical protein VLA34_11415, partial [Candidatus Krumholzibacterium sp.]|nr:hypothetical protein [Candidatus Krumholzibacterium sp.]
SSSDGEYGVFEYVVKGAGGTVDEIAQSIDQAAREAGWTVSAVIDPATDSDSGFRAKVLVLFHEGYAAQLMEANSSTGAYAVLDRVNVFQDENGTHVSVVNPKSITRTVLMDDESFGAQSEEHLQALRAIILSAVTGTESDEQYGQIRSEGLIGKTMGVVAGGNFADLIRKKASEKNADVAEVASRVAAGMSDESRKWRLKLAYRVDIPGSDVVILGTTGSPMDTKSFEIVGAGTDESRKEFRFPGLSHAGAYPIEVVVSRDGDEVKVEMVEAMFRMKMYFEDAGKMSFMKNMKMPGSIDQELKKQISEGLKSR